MLSTVIHLFCLSSFLVCGRMLLRRTQSSHPLRRSKVENVTNVQILVVSLLLLVMSLVSCVGVTFWNDRYGRADIWYIGKKGKCQSMARSRHFGKLCCFYFISFIKKNFFFFLVALDLHCCMQVFSSCGEQGLLFIAVHGLLIAVASLVAEHGL